jgi:hypothetical protein
MRIQRDGTRSAEWVGTLAYDAKGLPMVTWSDDIQRALAIHPDEAEPLALYLGDGCYTTCIGEGEQLEAIAVQEARRPPARDDSDARRAKALEQLAEVVPEVAERRAEVREREREERKGDGDGRRANERA